LIEQFRQWNFWELSSFLSHMGRVFTSTINTLRSEGRSVCFYILFGRNIINFRLYSFCFTE
jgi:hypothetical protein